MIERKITIGLITSTEYCKRIQEGWDPAYIESATAYRITAWVWEYFDKYGKAPGKEIEMIFFSKLRTDKIPKDLAEEIENEILPGLSNEYVDEGLNVDLLIEETEQYFNGQHIKLFAETIQYLQAENKFEEASKIISEFRPFTVTSKKRLEHFILTVDQIRKKERHKSKVLFRPWLVEGQTTIIYAAAGVGKTLLTLTIAYLLGMRKYDDPKCDIGEWFVDNPTGCLYIDGEMGEREIEERIKQFEWLGEQQRRFKLHLLSVPEYQLETEDTFYLSNRPNQIKVLDWLRSHPKYKVVILDSASTLFGLVEENDNSEWNNKINPFLRDLRALGVACILLHHSGKDWKKGLRGASSMGAMAHNIFQLANNPDKEPGVANFRLMNEKQRTAGKTFSSFSIKFIQEDGKRTHWEVT